LLQALFDIGEKMERNLEAYIKTYKMLDEETCKQTIKEIEEIHWSQHTFYNVTDGSYGTRSGEKELDIGYSQTSTKNVIMQKIWDSYLNYVKDLNFSWWSSWSGYTEVRFNRYKETRLMAEHCDHIHSIFEGERKGIPVMTALGSLNDDYTGGEFVMFEDTVIPFKAGEIKIFPSCFLFPHRIDPVTEGTRYSFVSWAW
jgi:predicted 2-oxoglutarate/Fe(II)-dependent dioxygenase YbiX